MESMDSGAGSRRGNARLPPEVNRVVYVRNLPFKISAEEIYDIFGKYGALRQVRLGDKPDTRGTAFVVYEDIYDAKNAVDHLNGFNVCGRYLVVLYYQASKMQERIDNQRKRQELEELKKKYNIQTEAAAQ
uniref:RRM domain-containing protein n=1 Tax=Rhizochromulina marina TaxID=1034831 RepID=A0A7S2S8J7_9STRA|mmetsp:Transcript_26662/g.77587  ORF Transcript_26662/g.77587 Transcript_26662/m.77587 type:complete len:131 (+) Transcript_26662:156-548(+)|eukprot:CAMPEP_0118969962 /NCGR_PEP_ID=MMETSP1173-20130426/6964_1 /TAXON_ID=1034831 /ORGANISM="Rhizochromulina marina cf, Strain CCMP1243" /LENGTH=130 /DNA_ID=CAMNT_0006919263 /DNA_START=156 /DNA_END=548 /DNA_ORIENTATION=-